MIAISRLAYAATAAVALAAIPAHGLAQSTKVLFLPGKGEGSSDWSSTVSAVQSSGLQLSSVGAADLPGGSVFPSQLSWLTTYYSSSLGSNSVVIGHSNGGIVARLASYGQSLLGTATIASPNQGLPAITNADALVEYGSDMLWDAAVTINDFLAGDYYWLLDDVFLYAYDYWVELGGGMELVEDWAGLGSPVAVQDEIGSGFLVDTLNASSHVSTELANSGTSVAVRVVAENYYYGGPLRLVSSASGAYDWHVFINGLGVGLLGGAQYIYNNSYPLTDQNYREMDDLTVLSVLLFNYEDAWCAGISEPHYYEPWIMNCYDNDGFVPQVRQGRPGSVTVVDWSGASAHKQEVNETDRIVTLLNAQFSIPF